MTATARFFHQLRHDFRASRLVLLLLWALLILSVPNLWLQWSARSALTESSSIFREADLLSGWAALFATLCLAFLIAKITPSDTEAFYHSRPQRSGILVLSAVVLFVICVLLPVLIQQAVLCWMAVGSIPWSEMLLRLLLGTLPYAVCFAFAFIVGNTVRQRCVLLLATLIFLYYTRFSGLHREADDIFTALPWNVRSYLSAPFSMGYYSWASELPHPELRMIYSLILLAIALAVSLGTWRWRRCVVPAVIFFAGIATAHHLITGKAGHSARWLTADQERTAGLDKTSVTTSGSHLLSTGPPAGGFEFKVLPTVHDLPPQFTATVGMIDPILRSPGKWEIHGWGYFYGGPNQHTNFNRAMRLAPRFLESLLGSPVVSLSPTDKDSNDRRETDRDLRPANMAVFMHEDAVPLGNGPAQPETVHWLQPVEAESDLALPVNSCRVLAHIPLRPGVHWRQGAYDLRLSKLEPIFKTIRTSSGAGLQWAGCGVAFWYSSLVFDRHDERQQSSGTMVENLIPILYHPGRHEMLGDLKSLGSSRSFAGTPVSMSQHSQRFMLEESRIGSLDEHWLDGAELVLIEPAYVGLLKRHMAWEGLQPVKDQTAE